MMAPVRAMIFDLDGTLVDTELLHFEAYNRVLGSRGICISRTEYFGRFIGHSDYDCFALLLRQHRMRASESTIYELIAMKSIAYQAMAAEHARFFPGALEFVRQCAERFPLVLVTGTLRVEAELLLRKGQIRELFAEIVAAEDVRRGKPAPDGFRLAPSRLRWMKPPQHSVRAKECLAVEDTRAGVIAAQRAGMRVLAVAHTVSPEELKSAELKRPSLAKTDLDEVLQVLTQPCN